MQRLQPALAGGMPAGLLRILRPGTDLQAHTESPQRETEVAKLLVCRVVWTPVCVRLTCLPICPRTSAACAGSSEDVSCLLNMIGHVSQGLRAASAGPCLSQSL